MKKHFDNFWRYRYLLQHLVMRDFRLKYRRSVLGVVWSVLNPLLMCLVYWVVFSTIFETRDMGIENFPVFLICGQLLFSFFADTTSSGMSSVLTASALLKKVYVPKYIFPLEKCCFGMVNTFFSFIALILIMIFTGNPFTPAALLCIYPLITLFFFSLGVALILSACTVFFRDIMHMWSVFTTALMYFSAIFYEPTAFGGNIVFGLSLQTLIGFNPLYWYITAFRTTVMNGELLTINMWVVCGACAVVSMILGCTVFSRTQDRFVLHI